MFIVFFLLLVSELNEYEKKNKRDLLWVVVGIIPGKDQTLVLHKFAIFLPRSCKIVQN